MGAAVPELSSVDESTAEALLMSLRTISAPERRKHASVYNYWLAIRRDRQFPPIRDLDPLEISDVGPFSLLLEMIGGGEDAEIRHVGHAIQGGIKVDKIVDAPNPSLLSCIATRLPVVAACRDAFAFEDEFETADGKTRCWVTLLPFSATGSWIDYVYGFVSLDSAAGAAAEVGQEPEQPFEVPVAEEAVEPLELTVEEPVDEVPEPAPEAAADVELGPLELEEVLEPEEAAQADGPEEPAVADAPEATAAADEPVEAAPQIAPTVSEKFFENLESAGGFYGRPVEIELDPATVSFETGEAETPVSVDEPSQPKESNPTPEGTLDSKLTEVRAKADEARQAKLRANSALYEGLSAAYDFALDAEERPEEYLKLVQEEGLKIQLRSPMRPIAKLAFDGMCDEATIKQLEAILAWAFDEELPRGSLAERIEAAGGIGPILSGQAQAA